MLEALLAEQAALRRVATLAAGAPDSGRLFEAVCEEVGRVLAVESAALLRYEEDRTATIVAEWTSRDTAWFEPGASLPVDGETVTAKLRRSGRPERVDDYTGLTGELAALLREVGIRSAVGAPIEVAGRLWGCVIASSGRTHGFPRDTEQRIADFAKLVTAALANVDAHEQLAASRARIVESGDAARRRIERDLHDGAQQRLVSLALSLRMLQARLRDRELAGELESARAELEQALSELRELARGIHPSVLSDRGLGAALEALANRSPVPVELETLDCAGLPAPVATTAYFVVAEALTNVAKHARGEHAEVRARVEGDWLAIEARDDGVGGADAAGSGLRGLQDRVSALGGVLEIDSPPGAGTAIRARIAVSAPETSAS